MRPNQFAARIKMKTVAKNQNVLLTKCEPMTPSKKPYRLSVSHSRKFWSLWNLLHVSGRRLGQKNQAGCHDPGDDHGVGDREAKRTRDLNRLPRQAFVLRTKHAKS